MAGTLPWQTNTKHKAGRDPLEPRPAMLSVLLSLQRTTDR
jgi:hypothetical protein